MDFSKRYWLIEFAHYYPRGGLNDVRSTHDSEGIARIAFQKIANYNRTDFYLWDNKEYKMICDQVNSYVDKGLV